MSKKLNSMPNYTANLPHQAHDVSQSTAYTSCPGMLSPVYHDMLHVGDKIHFSASEFVRLNPLITQPLGKIDVHLDYFFVPLSVLYTPTTSLFYQTDDLLSDLFGNSPFDTSSFPVYDFHAFLEQFHQSNPSSPDAYITGNCLMYPAKNTMSALTLNNGAFDCRAKSVYRIMDFLDMAPDALLDSIAGIQDPNSQRFISDLYPRFTPWFALAYQAIYQLYFRNDDREPKNYHYNIDSYGYNGGRIFDDVSTAKSIFFMNYCNRPKDYFNSVKVSPMFSSVSMLNAPGNIWNSVNNWLNEYTFSSSEVDGSPDVGLPDDCHLITQTSAFRNNVLSSNNIRQLFMVDKLLRVIGRSEKNYESQFLAHYGVKIPHDAIHNITHIGHDMMTITPEAVISNADTFNADDKSGSALGEIGGQGSGMLSGRKHHFEAPFHGVFMVISHIIPRQRYVVGLSKLHMLNSPVDFYQPEFDKKGMQPLFAYESIMDMDLFTNNDNNMSTMLGWQFAYEQFKRKYDRVTRAFSPSRWTTQTVNTYSPWVISSRPLFMYDKNTNNEGYWIPRGSLNACDFLVSPCSLNVNMQVPYNPSWPVQCVGTQSDLHKPWLLYQTDPFIIDFNLYIKKVNIMSEYGEPEL